MPGAPVMGLPKSKTWPSLSSSGVSEVTALRRLAATRTMAANASRRPLSRGCRMGDWAGVDIAYSDAVGGVV